MTVADFTNADAIRSSVYHIKHTFEGGPRFVFEALWWAARRDTLCIAARKALDEHVGLGNGQAAAVSHNADGALEAETLLNAYADALMVMAAQLSPVLERRVAALGPMVALITDDPTGPVEEQVYENFLRSIFEDAGIADRFSAI